MKSFILKSYKLPQNDPKHAEYLRNQHMYYKEKRVPY